VHVSATSQSPAAARQVTVEGWKASAGQEALDPVHVSATSQSPAAGRQVVDDEANPSAGQSGLAPVQVSATSQSPAAGRQTTCAGTSASAGQVGLVPSHISGRSQTPVAARQVVPALPATWPQAPVDGVHESTVHTLASSHDSAAIAVWQRTSSAPMSGVVGLR